jgi:hypothetical protein
MIYRNKLALLLLGPKQVMEYTSNGLEGYEGKRYQTNDRVIAVELWCSMSVLSRCEFEDDKPPD